MASSEPVIVPAHTLSRSLRSFDRWNVVWNANYIAIDMIKTEQHYFSRFNADAGDLLKRMAAAAPVDSRGLFRERAILEAIAFRAQRSDFLMHWAHPATSQRLDNGLGFKKNNSALRDFLVGVPHFILERVQRRPCRRADRRRRRNPAQLLRATGGNSECDAAFFLSRCAGQFP
jgi:hypothetical protein